MVNRFLSWLEWRLLPGQCILCGAASRQRADICQNCLPELPLLESHCLRCALPLPETVAECGQCLRQPPPFQHTVAGWIYQTPVKQLISSLKYQRQYSHGRVLAELLAKRLSPYPLPDFIVPTPLHWSRHWQRGFNQSELLSQQLAKQLSIPISHCLKRIRRTPSQQQLNAKQRQRNLRGAFVVRGNIEGKSFAIVDDVVTTGSTARETSQVLMAAGASEVQIWCLARTPK